MLGTASFTEECNSNLVGGAFLRHFFKKYSTGDKSDRSKKGDVPRNCTGKYGTMMSL